MESSENGVPFLRVQNVTEEGISLEDCKYINFETHNGMLKRSQVKEGYLITKITGVGRMAVSSVAPKGFEGNINQHLVAIKTDDYQTSELLAAFLNSDIGEKLAFRRSTGGTRPALDYQALKTIPVVFKPEIVESMQSAYKQKKQKETEAQKLLDSIDSYVLDELGIKLPEVEEKMCFVVDSEEAQGNRADAYYYQPKFEEVDKALNHVGYKKFKELLEIITKGETPLWRGDLYLSRGIPFIKVQNISQEGIKGELTYISEEVHNRMKRSQLNGGELLYTMAGTIGIATIFPEDFGVANINQAIAKIILKKDINKEFIKCVLNSNICKLQTQRFLTTFAQPNINFEQIKSLKIPFPPLEIQNKIAEEVKRRISEAERLKAEASKIIEEAKKQVEGMILGG
jgi:restriction endonuclease S subunit